MAELTSAQIDAAIKQRITELGDKAGPNDPIIKALVDKKNALSGAQEPAGAFSGTNLTTGARGAGEALAGLPGDVPSMEGGIVKWLGTQAAKIPYADKVGITPENAAKAGAVVQDFGEKTIPIHQLVRGLQSLGVLPGEGVPTTGDIHATVSSNLSPEAEKYSTYQPQNAGEEAVQFAEAFVPNLLFGNKAKAGQGLFDLGTKVATRVAAPTAALSGADALADRLQSEGLITPETATALKTIAVVAAGGGGAVVERAAQQRAAASLVKAQPAELKAIYEAMVADGMDPMSARAFITNLGQDAMLADLGPNTRNLAQRAATTPGAGKTALVTGLERRHEGEGARLQQERETAMGPAGERDVVKGEIKQDLKDIGADYPAAHQAQRVPIDAKRVIDDIDTELGSVKDAGLRKILKDVRDSLHIQDVHGVARPNLDPSSKGVMAAREAIDTKLYDAAGNPKLTLSPTEVRLLQKYRGAIDDLIEGAAPDVKKVDTRYSEKAGEKQAFKTGEQALAKGDAATSGEFQRVWDKMTLDQRRRAIQGASRFVETQMGLTPHERGRLKTLLGGELNEAKLSTMIGPEKTKTFMEAMRREDIYNETYQKVVHGSRTGDILEHGASKPGLGKDVVENALITGGTSGSVSAGVTAGSVTAARNFIRRNRGVIDPELRSRIGVLLASGDPTQVIKAADMVRRARSRRLSPAAVGAGLSSRAAEQREDQRTQR